MFTVCFFSTAFFVSGKLRKGLGKQPLGGKFRTERYENSVKV